MCGKMAPRSSLSLSNTFIVIVTATVLLLVQDHAVVVTGFCATRTSSSRQRSPPHLRESTVGPSREDRTRMMSFPPRSTSEESPESRFQFLGGMAGGMAALALPLAAFADPPLEMFKDKEVCIERNLNGACKKYGVREDSTEEAPPVAKTVAIPEEPESELITTLKRRTAENKERNDEEVATKTFVNGQAGEFGIFSRYVPVKHADTGRYELILNPEVEEMRKAGLVVRRGGTEYFVDEKEETQ